MRRIGEAMPLEPGGKARIELWDPGKLQNVEVRIDGEVLHRFPDARSLRSGWRGDVPGEHEARIDVALRRRYGALFPRLDVRVNGRALPGSAWDPERLRNNGSMLLLALGAWPLMDLLSADPDGRNTILVQAALLAGAGALARVPIRGVAVTAMFLGTAFLALRAVLLFVAPDVAWHWRALAVLVTLWTLRDARASIDLRPSAGPRSNAPS
jgi:hypothetical protein